MKLWPLLVLLESTTCFAIEGYSREVIGGDILHSVTVQADSELKAKFLAEQASIRAVSAECGFPHRDIRVFRRQTVEEFGYITATSVSGISFESCEQAKAVANIPERARHLANPTLVEDQERYIRYLEKELLPAEPDWLSNLTSYLKSRFDQIDGKQNVTLERLERLRQSFASIPKNRQIQPSIILLRTRSVGSRMADEESCWDRYRSLMSEAQSWVGKNQNLAEGRASFYYNEAQKLSCVRRRRQ